jgi:hypothetical protein
MGSTYKTTSNGIVFLGTRYSKEIILDHFLLHNFVILGEEAMAKGKHV